ncbi:hypothetical protein [Flavobacterium panacagri]|uniref:hypothetical protein n=1 Tax=Flavobacterium panacagri TaxID=3034146 RepID=UPI0025A5BA2C|nr:hypothetical protein [Flavobacterium panacagri]
MKNLILLLSLLLVFISCKKDKQSQKKENNAVEDTTNIVDSKNDSIALLALTKKLYEWEEKKSTGSDFSPVEDKNVDSIYSGIDMKLHKARLKELENTHLFSKDFIDNYNKIALKIDSEFKSGALKWNVGELPPFGTGASPWCNCQDKPDRFLDKIWIMHLSIENNKAFYNWSWGDGTVYNVKAVKENNEWKISYLEGFDYDSFVESFQKTNDFTGRWKNDMVALNIGNKSLAFEYHGQCVYFYPVRKISDTEFEMIWAKEMDCKFDNGTDETFGLKEIPQLGKPFSKLTLKNNVLHVQYYYKKWVEKYSEQVSGVFTSEYEKEREEYEF